MKFANFNPIFQVGTWKVRESTEFGTSSSKNWQKHAIDFNLA